MPYSLEVQYQQVFGMGEFALHDHAPYAIYPDFFYQRDLHHEAVFAPGFFDISDVVPASVYPDFIEEEAGPLPFR